MIYVFGGIKGGVGKTTICLNFIAYLASINKRDVLLVDADDQETATDYTAWRDNTLGGDIGYTAIKLAGDAIRMQIPNLKKKYDDIVIDTGGRDTISQRSALSVANIYLVPFYPRSFDFWTITKVEHLVDEIRSINPDLQVLSFLNRADLRSADNRDTADALRECKDIVYIDKPILNRKCFSNASGRGLSVFEITPRDEKAISELTGLFENLTKEYASA
ncbi:MAG: chromosome partitioning protein ParA [Pedobacter sp.]|nr:MAG: chromosome partitioning protein ParA [Pedobacter sp.]